VKPAGKGGECFNHATGYMWVCARTVNAGEWPFYLICSFIHFYFHLHGPETEVEVDVRWRNDLTSGWNCTGNNSAW